MPTQIDICNRALLKLGAEKITSLSDESREAQAVKLAWEGVRDREISLYSWSFAMRRASIAASATAPEWGYEKQYPLPVDCLYLEWVESAARSETSSNYNSVGDDAYRVEGRSILTDLAAPLRIVYKARVEDPNAWDVCFQNVMATALAIEIADEITADLQRKNLLLQQYSMYVAEGRKANAIQNPPRPIPDDSWITSRL